VAKKTISTLNIKVTASSEGVRKGLGKAKGDLKGFKTGAATAMKGIAAAAAVAAAAVAAIGLAAKKALAKMLEAASGFDELVKRARALNIEVEQLEAVSLLAEFSGADAGKAGQAMERLTISIGDATRGTGEAADAFKKLGLNVDTLKAQSVVDSMEDIGKALQSVGTRAEQLDILSALVGSRQAGSLINTFDAMAGGLGGIRDVMDSIGLSLTKVQSDNIEEMNDAITLAKKSSEAFWRQLVAELAPSITQVALASAEFMAELTPFVPAIARTIEGVVKLSAAMSPLLWVIKGTVKAAKNLGLIVDKEVAEKFKAARAPVDTATAAIAKTVEVVDELKESMHDAFDPDKVARLREELEGLSDVTAPGFQHGSTFGGVKGSAGGMAAVNAAARNRNQQMREERKFRVEQAKLDRKRNELIKELLLESLKPPPEPVKVKKKTIVG
tara:strand:+ start:4089 stop:5420 length:1332 start_codon:yes stop_codon:yes gene_type:complete